MSDQQRLEELERKLAEIDANESDSESESEEEEKRPTTGGKCIVRMEEVARERREAEREAERQREENKQRLMEAPSEEEEQDDEYDAASVVRDSKKRSRSPPPPKSVEHAERQCIKRHNDDKVVRHGEKLKHVLGTFIVASADNACVAPHKGSDKGRLFPDWDAIDWETHLITLILMDEPADPHLNPLAFTGVKEESLRDPTKFKTCVRLADGNLHFVSITGARQRWKKMFSGGAKRAAAENDWLAKHYVTVRNFVVHNTRAYFDVNNKGRLYTAQVPHVFWSTVICKQPQAEEEDEEPDAKKAKTKAASRTKPTTTQLPLLHAMATEWINGPLKAQCTREKGVAPTIMLKAHRKQSAQKYAMREGESTDEAIQRVVQAMSATSTAELATIQKAPNKIDALSRVILKHAMQVYQLLHAEPLNELHATLEAEEAKTAEQTMLASHA